MKQKLKMALLAIALMLISIPIRADSDVSCLARAIYFESRGESQHCQEKVAHVVLNRVEHKKFSNSVCGVIYAKNQFSWTKHKPVVRNHALYKQHHAMATKVMADHRSNKRKDTTNGSLFFNATGKRFKGTKQSYRCGNHTFFRYR